MKIQALEPSILVHDVPFEKIICDSKNGNKLLIEFDDENEKRYRIDFITHIVLKVVRDDCFDSGFLSSVTNDGMMYELLDSEWIYQLKKDYYNRRKHEHLMDGTHHYLIILGDYYVEIIARGYNITKLDDE